MDCMNLSVGLHFWKALDFWRARNLRVLLKEKISVHLSEQIQSWQIYLIKFPKWFRVELNLEILENRMSHEETPPNVHMHNSSMVTIINSSGVWERLGIGTFSLWDWAFPQKGIATGFVLEKSCYYSCKKTRRRIISPPPQVSFCQRPLGVVWGNFTDMLTGNSRWPCGCYIVDTIGTEWRWNSISLNIRVKEMSSTGGYEYWPNEDIAYTAHRLSWI